MAGIRASWCVHMGVIKMKKNSGVPMSHYIVIIGIVLFFFIKAFVEPAIINAACDL